MFAKGQFVSTQLKQSLICTFLMTSFISGNLYAQSLDAEDWPEDIEARPYNSAPEYFNKSNNPIVKRYEQMEAEDKAAEDKSHGTQSTQKQTSSEHSEKNQQSKHRLWPFQRKQKIKPLTHRQITRVGPRETSPVKDPLLALPVNLQLPSGSTLRSGFYLIRQTELSQDRRELQFVRENRVLYQCQAIRSSNPGENTDSPLSVTNPSLPSAISPVIKVIVSVANANSGQSAVLILQDNGQRFQTEAFPVVEDERPKLRND